MNPAEPSSPNPKKRRRLFRVGVGNRSARAAHDCNPHRRSRRACTQPCSASDALAARPNRRTIPPHSCLTAGRSTAAPGNAAEARREPSTFPCATATPENEEPHCMRTQRNTEPSQPHSMRAEFGDRGGLGVAERASRDRLLSAALSVVAMTALLLASCGTSVDDSRNDRTATTQASITVGTIPATTPTTAAGAEPESEGNGISGGEADSSEPRQALPVVASELSVDVGG